MSYEIDSIKLQISGVSEAKHAMSVNVTSRTRNMLTKPLAFVACCLHELTVGVDNMTHIALGLRGTSLGNGARW